MKDRLSQTDYDILNEAKCGPEEFFVLVSSIDFESREGLMEFLSSINRLLVAGLIEAHRGGRPAAAPSLADLEDYVSMRKLAGESLDEHPKVVDEYSFSATESGISLLDEPDQPTSSAPS